MKTSTYPLLSATSIRELLRSPGPAITVVLPPYQPGSGAGATPDQLKSFIREAQQQLAAAGIPMSSILTLLAPLQALAADPEFASGSQTGLVLFRSPDLFEVFELTQPAEPSLTVAGVFALRRVARELARPPLFLILALSKDKVGLVRCDGLQSTVVPLPRGVPATLAEALALEPPDHDLENRATAGGAAGGMHRIRFGTGAGYEQIHSHLADYYRIVDRGIREEFHDGDIPVIPAGIEDDVAQFRAVASYPHLATSSLFGSPDVHTLSRPEVLRLAFTLLREEQEARNTAEFTVTREKFTPERVATDLVTILRAAREGRVARLYLSDGAAHSGVFEHNGYTSPVPEDLLNLAFVWTIQHHGKASLLPAGSFAGFDPAAALLRF